MTRRLHLVRHARPVVDPCTPPGAWPLVPGQEAAIAALGRTVAPVAGVWSSPEVKAVATAGSLGLGPVVVVPGLHELSRTWADDGLDDLTAAGFAAPDRPAAPGWETVAAATERVLTCVDALLGAHGGDIVLVGHGTVWTLLDAELSGTEPSPATWRSWSMPDLRSYEVGPSLSGTSTAE